MAGKTIMVTGAPSGLGEHFTRFLAADGAHVILTARRRSRLDEIVADIKARGGTAEAVEMDVADAASAAAAFEAIEGPIDVVINNAGISGSAPALAQATAEFDSVVDTNLKGVFYVAQQAAARMRQDGGGAIVNIASILGLRVAGGVAAYAASKAAVVQLTKALALEWARYGVRVNALCPG